MRRLSLIVTAVLICAAVGGCTDEKKVGPIDDPTSKTTASPTPAKPTPPSLPVEAKGDSPKAATKFVEHYIALMNYSAATGDTAAMKAASRDCAGCTGYINLYEKTYADGGFFENPQWRLQDPIAERVGQHMTVLFDVEAPESKFKLKAGDPVSLGKGGSYKLRLDLVRLAGQWVVKVLVEQPKLS